MSAAFPWDEALGLALGVLRWSPEAFWRATPRELAAAVEALAGRRGLNPLARGDLERLMAVFPDEGPPVPDSRRSTNQRRALQRSRGEIPDDR